SLSLAAIKRELSKDEISKENIQKRLSYIESGIMEINDVLNQLNSIKKPIFSEYIKNIKMIEVDKKENKSD
ncbi:MAG TPA: hypothetical protein VLM39_07055, partial [Ignavibacteriaceae bacterium]|nr:hypothetical protein [Ignavibacteriaceae bacterium]